MKKTLLIVSAVFLLFMQFLQQANSVENQLASWFVKQADENLIKKYSQILKSNKFNEYCEISNYDQYSKIASISEKSEAINSEFEMNRHIMKLITTEDVIRNGDLLAWPLAFFAKRKVDFGVDDKEELKVVFILLEHLLDLDKKWKETPVSNGDNPFGFHYKAAKIFRSTSGLLNCSPSLANFIELSRIFTPRFDYKSDRRDDMLMLIISGSEWEKILDEADDHDLGSKRFRETCHYYIDGSKEAENNALEEHNLDNKSRGLKPEQKSKAKDLH